MKAGSAAQTILITGLANSGKTTLCNRLTKTYSLVANYPMTTIEPRTETYQFQDTRYSVIDMPGINSLTANSEEELVVRKIMLENPPDTIIQCIDMHRIKQSLYLTSDLLSLGIPMVICLTNIEETAGRGDVVDFDHLSKILQIPIIEVPAAGTGRLYDLKEAVADAAGPGNLNRFPDSLEKVIESLSAVDGLPEQYRRSCAVLSLLGDPYVTDCTSPDHGYSFFNLNLATRRALQKAKEEAVEPLHGNAAAIVVNERGKWTDRLYKRVSTGTHEGISQTARKVAYYSRHPVWGLLFLAVVLSVMYLLVVNAAGWLAGVLDMLIAVPIISFLDRMLSSPFLHSLLIGDYGLLTLGVFNAFITVLPILSLFFFLLGLLEDIGYLPNLSVLMRRLFSRLGLSGKAVMPIILGFGCKTMATMTTRSMKSRKERLIAIYLIAFAIPCSAQLGLNFAILGNAGVSAFIITALVLFFIEIAAGVILNKIIRNDSRQLFVQELPPFRVPRLADILKKTGYRGWWFLKEAVPIFLIAALVIFTLDLVGVLNLIKQVLEPLVVRWLGLPIEFVDALILMLAREEAAAGLILKLSRAGMLDYVQSIVAVVVTTMFVPCFANIVAMFKEAGAKVSMVMLVGINLSTILLGGILNWAVRSVIGLIS